MKRRSSEGWSLSLSRLGVDLVKKIAPVGIGFPDQIEFPLPLPGLDRFFTSDGILDTVVPLNVNEVDQAMPMAEDRADTLTMLVNTPSKIGSNANI